MNDGNVMPEDKQEYILPKKEIELLERLFIEFGSQRFKQGDLILKETTVHFKINGDWYDMPRYGYGLAKT